MAQAIAWQNALQPHIHRLAEKPFLCREAKVQWCERLGPPRPPSNITLFIFNDINDKLLSAFMRLLTRVSKTFRTFEFCKFILKSNSRPLWNMAHQLCKQREIQPKNAVNWNLFSIEKSPISGQQTGYLGNESIHDRIYQQFFNIDLFNSFRNSMTARGERANIWPKTYFYVRSSSLQLQTNWVNYLKV